MNLSAGHGLCQHGGPEVYKELPQIHTGKVAFQEGPLDRMIWTKIGSMHSQLFTIDPPSHMASSSAIFAVVSEAGSNGFPGALRIEARIAIQSPDGSSFNSNQEIPGRSAGVLRVEYRAQIIDNCQATPLNITQHWGFNLSASDSHARALEQGTTNHHLLRIKTIDENNSLYTLGLGKQMIPNGKLLKCEKGGEHDWLQSGSQGLGRPLKEPGRTIDYDHFYVWGRLQDEWKQREIEKESRLTLHSPSTKLTLSFKTNQSGTQIYHAIGQPDAPAPVDSSGGRKKDLHEDNPDSPSGYSKNSIVFLEFAHPHATFLHKEYQEIAKDDTIVKKHQRYRNWVEVEVYKD